MSRLVIIAAILLLAAPAGAQEQPAGRYALQTSPGGFVRLDTRTGAVSHCGQRDGRWFCEPFAEEGATLNARIEGLERELKELAAAVARLGTQVESRKAQRPEQPTPSEAEIDQALGFSETLMKRFFGMVREMKKESVQ
jgi:hypothetical protein